MRLAGVIKADERGWGDKKKIGKNELVEREHSEKSRVHSRGTYAIGAFHRRPSGHHCIPAASQTGNLPHAKLGIWGKKLLVISPKVNFLLSAVISSVVVR